MIADRRDYEYSKNVIRDRGLGERGGLLLSAVQGMFDPAQLAAWILEDGLPVRLQIQLHKILWPEKTKGV